MSNATVIKIKKTVNYTVMSNEHFHVVNMSLRAKGLLSLILSLSSNWTYSIKGLATLCSDSYNTVATTLKELEELGYLEIKKVYPSKETNGKISYEYTIYENSIKPEKLILNSNN